MAYIRTKEIKQKQSNAMKKVHENMDYTKTIEKRKKTIEEQNSKVGRPKKNFIKIIPCETCNNLFESTLTSSKTYKKYCGRNCYYESKKNKPWFFGQHDKSYMQTESYHNSRVKEYTPEFLSYRRLVSRLTEETYVKYMNDINPNKYPRTLAGVNGGYQLDHITSVYSGFISGISVEEISNKTNLQMLPWLENVKKGKK